MFSLLWVPITVFAGLTQLWRNSLQSELTAQIGVLGATQVRFVYGVPFAWAMFGVAAWLTGIWPSLTGSDQAGWILLGALTQIGGTALMLVAMRMRSFAAAYVYIKTEAVLIALGGMWFLGDYLSPIAWIGIALATMGVMLLAIRTRQMAQIFGDLRPAVVGIASGALFGMSAIAFRGAILAGDVVVRDVGSAFVSGLFVLGWALLVQSSLLMAYMVIADRAALVDSIKAWRKSLGAGALGALASAGWFIAFALTPAANVRTLGLIEMPGAALLNRRQSGVPLPLKEWIAMLLVLVGVALVLHQAMT